MPTRRRNPRHTTRLEDLPEKVRVTRPNHALNGKTLNVFGHLKRNGRLYLLLVLPDGSRSRILAAWTDCFADTASEIQTPPSGLPIASLSDLWRFRQRIDALVSRNQAVPTNPNQSDHATSANRAVDGGTSDSADLPKPN